jgi:cell division protein FtsL
MKQTAIAAKKQPAKTRVKVIKGQRKRANFAIYVFTATLCLIALFATVAGRAILASNQIKLDNLNAKLSKAETETEKLKATLNSLESPSRISQIAQSRYGMSTPSTVTYINPATGVLAPSQGNQPSNDQTGSNSMTPTTNG